MFHLHRMSWLFLLLLLLLVAIVLPHGSLGATYTGKKCGCHDDSYVEGDDDDENNTDNVDKDWNDVEDNNNHFFTTYPTMTPTATVPTIVNTNPTIATTIATPSPSIANPILTTIPTIAPTIPNIVTPTPVIATAAPTTATTISTTNPNQPSQQPQQQQPTPPPLESDKDAFEATILMSVSDDILTATKIQALTFQNNFLKSYNQLQSQQPMDDEDVVIVVACDLLNRTLTNVIGYDPDYHINARGNIVGGVRMLRNLPHQSSQYSNNNNETEMELSTQLEVQRILQTKKNKPKNQTTKVMVKVSGSCSGCQSNTNLFYNDVSNRLRRQLQQPEEDPFLYVEQQQRQQHQQSTSNSSSLVSSQNSIEEACPPGTTEFRPPTTEDMIVLFNANNNASGLPYDTTGILQLLPQPCPVPINRFESDVYTFTLAVSPLSLTNSVAFHNVMRYLTTQDILGQYYNDEFLAEKYCDPLYRYITNVVFLSSDILPPITRITYRIGGICRGCINLFGNESTTTTTTTNTNNDNLVRRRLRQQQQQQQQRQEWTATSGSQKNRQLQDQNNDQCWCASGTLPRPPTRAEFEDYLTNKFLELSTWMVDAEIEQQREEEDSRTTVGTENQLP